MGTSKTVTKRKTAMPLQEFKTKMSALCGKDDKGFARLLVKYATALGEGAETESLAGSLDTALAAASYLIDRGMTESAGTAIDLIGPAVAREKVAALRQGTIHEGMALTLLGDVKSDCLAPMAALKAYQKAVKMLWTTESPAHLHRAMIRRASAELALGKTSAARKTLEMARQTLNAVGYADGKYVCAKLNLAQVQALLGYTWLLAGRNHARAADHFQQAIDTCHDDSERDVSTHEFNLVEATALSGVCSLEFLRGNPEKALSIASTVASITAGALEADPDDVQTAFLAASAMMKMAAVTYDSALLDTANKASAGVNEILSKFEGRLDSSLKARHTALLNNMVLAGVARRHGELLRCQAPAIDALKAWKKLLPKAPEPEFIVSECKRLCGFDLTSPGVPFIQLAALKTDDAIRGPLAVLGYRWSVIALDTNLGVQ